MSDDEQEEQKEQRRASPELSRRVKRDLARVVAEVPVKKLKQTIKAKYLEIVNDAVAKTNKWMANDIRFAEFRGIEILSCKRKGPFKEINFQITPNWKLECLFDKSKGEFSKATLAKMPNDLYSYIDRYCWSFSYQQNSEGKYKHVFEYDYTSYYKNHMLPHAKDKEKVELVDMISLMEKFISQDLLLVSKNEHKEKSILSAIFIKLWQEIEEARNSVEEPTELDSYQKMFGNITIPIGDKLWTLELVRRKEETPDLNID